MSYELVVYSSSEPPDDESGIRAGLASTGWCVVFVDSSRTLNPVPFRKAGVAIGIRANQPEFAQTETVLAGRDPKAFQDLYHREKLTAATVLVSPISDGVRDQLRDVVTDRAARQYAERILATQTIYVFETQASRNDAAVHFQRTLWAAVGAATLGILEDPEEGTFSDLPAEPPRRSWLSRLFHRSA